jgi:hypothetical protein
MSLRTAPGRAQKCGGDGGGEGTARVGLQHQSLLHLVGDSTAGNNGELSTELAAYDRRRRPCGPVNLNKAPLSDQAVPREQLDRRQTMLPRGRRFSANVAAHRRLRSSHVTSLAFIGVWLVIRLCLHPHNSRRYPLEGYN